MKKDKLAEEIINFCIRCKIIIKPFKNPQERFMVKKSVEEHLNDIRFVEGLIHTLIVKTQHNRKVNCRRLKILLLKLEKVRLDLEYGETGIKDTTVNLVRQK